VTLLDGVRGLLERTYRMTSGLGDLGPSIIGDTGFARLYHDVDFDAAGAADGQGARTVIRETAAGVRASVYFPDAMIRRLEQSPPQRGLDESNVDAFAVFVEELDHLLLLGERARQAREVRLVELELHANLSKYLVLSRFLAGSTGRVKASDRAWLRHRLFDGVVYREPCPEIRSRYESAARLAVHLIDALTPLAPPHRLSTLRRFHASPWTTQQHLIRTLAA